MKKSIKRLNLTLDVSVYERLISLCYAHAVTPEGYINHYSKIDEEELRSKGFSERFKD